MKDKLLLGYELGSAKEVHIFPSHLIVTGLTQLSGKTTTLEALIKRSEMKAIAFKTKIGETGFSQGYVIRPYFKEQSDWQYVESLLEATMKERLKFERSWIIRASKGTKSLEQVYENCKSLYKQSRDNSLQQGVYMNLIAYFELILPQISEVEFSHELKLRDGINIMDLEKLSDEVQSLVIRSVIEHVLKHERSTIVIIPEAWKFLPQDRGNPVKAVAESFIRQGATNKNFLWIDSQDMAGVDKTALKQVANWILGLQTERNEVQHTLDQIPLPAASKPKAEEIMTLRIGHFIVCNPHFTKKVYVIPSWLDNATAKEIALGSLPVEAVIGKKKLKLQDTRKFDDIALSTLMEKLKQAGNKITVLERTIAKQKSEIESYKSKLAKQKSHKHFIQKFNLTKAALQKLLSQLDSEDLSEVEQKTMTELQDIPKPKPTGIIDYGEAKTTHVLSQGDSASKQSYADRQTYAVPIEKNVMLQKLGAMARKIYEVLLENPNGMTKPQIALMTGYPVSGGMKNIIPRLQTMGLISKDGEVYRVV